MSVGQTSVTWAIVAIVVLPSVIIAAAELDERLRQRGSALRRAVLILRAWILPFFAAWTLLVPVLGVDSDSVMARVAASGLVLGVVLLVLSVLKVAVAAIRGRPRTEGRPTVPQLLLALPRLATIILAAWFFLGVVWGVNLSAALTALGVTSLVVSFALQGTLSGLASGILLLSDPPFQTGDWICVGDLEGVVVDLGWRTTTIRDRNGDTITVPNSTLSLANIVNYTTPEPRHRVVYPVDVAAVSPPTLAKAMLLDAALGTPGVLTEPAPQAVVTQIADPVVGYEVRMWVDDYAIVPQVWNDFGSLVWYQSQRHGVPLPNPAADLYVFDGVAASAAEAPTLSDIRTALQQSPLLTVLSDTELDRMAKASRSARFSAGEMMVDPHATSDDLFVIIEGRAQLVFVEAGQEESVIGELGPGELAGRLDRAPRDRGDLVGRASTDCQVLLVDAEVVAEVGSRNADLAAAFNRMVAIRRRRVERLLAHRSRTDTTPTSEPSTE